MSAGESIVLHACLGDAAHGRKPRQVKLEEIGTRGLAHKADVRNADGIALTVTPRLLAAGEIAFECLQGGTDPVMDPFQTRWFVQPEVMLEVFAHARHQERMGVAGDDLRKRAHPGPGPRRRGQERGLRVCLIQIFHDREGLEQRWSVSFDKSRKEHLRIHRAERGLTLRALHQIDIDTLVRYKTFEIECNANPERCERAPERIELHTSPPSLSCAGLTRASIFFEKSFE